MGLPNVVFNRSENGLGRPLPNNDHISGMIFQSNTYPSGFSATNKINKLYCIEDAESRGIVDTQTDETKATAGNFEMTTAGATGETHKLTLDGAVLGSYTVLVTDTTPTLVAVGLRAAVNALTYKHGFSAAGSTVNVLLSAPAKCGKSINTGKAVLAFVTGGTGAATVTQFSGGVGSFCSIMHYHISEFFREQPKGVLYVMITPIVTFTGADIATIRDYASGEIRQLGIYLQSETFATSHLTAARTYTVLSRTAHKPLEVLFHADMYASTLSTSSNLSLLTAADVSLVISEEGNFLQTDYSNTKTYIMGDKVNWAGKIYIAKSTFSGNPPFESGYWSEVMENIRDITGYSISTLGNALGVCALSKVHENIGAVERFDVSSGNTLDVLGFVTGDLYVDISDSLKDTLNDYHYIFLRKFVGRTGSTYNDSWTAIAQTNDYCTIENNRTMDKAERNIYTAAVGKVNTVLYVNADGTLTEDTIAIFKNTVEKPLEDMQIAGEVSGFSVTINPLQDVLGTSTIIITFRLLPVGVARTIQINSGFTTKIV
jgi:Protein of unknown function (DUF2586)